MRFHNCFRRFLRLSLFAALAAALSGCVSYYKPPAGSTVTVRVNAAYTSGASTLQLFSDPFTCQQPEMIAPSETSQFIPSNAKFSIRLAPDRIHTMRYQFVRVNQVCTVHFSFKPKADLEYEIALEQTGTQCSAAVRSRFNKRLPVLLADPSMYGRGGGCSPMSQAQFNSNEETRRARLDKAIDDVLRGATPGRTPSVKIDDLEGLLGK